MKHPVNQKNTIAKIDYALLQTAAWLRELSQLRQEVEVKEKEIKKRKSHLKIVK